MVPFYLSTSSKVFDKELCHHTNIKTRPHLHLHIVLPQSVERELGLVIDVDLHGILHELLADGTNILRQCRREHHHLQEQRANEEKDMKQKTGN